MTDDESAWEAEVARVEKLLQARGIHDGPGESAGGFGRLVSFAELILYFADDLLEMGDPAKIIDVTFNDEGDPLIVLDRALTVTGLAEKKAEIEALASVRCTQCATLTNARARFGDELRPACTKHGGASFFNAGDHDVLCLLTHGGAYLLSGRVGYAKVTRTRPQTSLPVQIAETRFLDGLDGSHSFNLDITRPVDPGSYRIRGSNIYTTVMPSMVALSFVGDLVEDLDTTSEHVLLTPYETWVTEPGDDGEVLGRQWLPIGFTTTPRPVDPYEILNRTPGAGLILRVREKSRHFADILTPIEQYAPGWADFVTRIRADVDELCDAAGFPRFTLQIGSFVNLSDDTTSKSASLGPWFAANNLVGPMPKSVEQRLYKAYEQTALTCSVCGVVGVPAPERHMMIGDDGRLTPVEPEPPAGPVVRKYQLQEIDWDALDGVVSAPRCDEHAPPRPDTTCTVIG